MKQTRNCNECGGTNIRTTTVAAGGGHQDLLPGAHPWWKGGKLEVFVCATCGYFQFFVPSDVLANVIASEEFKRFI
jgi:predicted nucleic-acid-binding Zn-ribbon protein